MVVLPIVEQWCIQMGILRTITTKGIMPSREAHDTSTVRPIQARALMHMKHL